MNEKLATAWLLWMSTSEYELPYKTRFLEMANEKNIALTEEDLNDLFKIKVWDDELLLPVPPPAEVLKKVETLIEILSEAGMKKYDLISEVVWNLLPDEWQDQYDLFLLKALERVAIEQVEIKDCCAFVRYRYQSIAASVSLPKKIAKELVCKSMKLVHK